MSSSNVRPLRSRLAQDNVERFEEFANDLRTALAKSVPTNLARYKHAAVLAITWNNDDIGVMPQTDQLLWILRSSYNFVTEKCILDANRSPHQLRRDLSDHILSFYRKHESKTDDNDHLLIYYYSGHSDAGPAQDQLRLSGRLQANHQLASPWLDWYQISHLALSLPRADTFMMLDSCNAAMAGIKGHSEVLTASGWETTTSASLNQSFTRFLIDEFTAANGRALTAAQLHSRLMGNEIVRNMSATPIHVAHPDGKPSVLFHKILGRDARDNQLMPQEIAGKVVLKVSVLGRGSIPNAGEWAEWLSTNMPPDIRDIELLDQYESTSVCLLVAVPVVLWDYLPPRAGYEYVSRYWGPIGQGGSRPGVSQQTSPSLSLRPANLPRQSDVQGAPPAVGSSSSSIKGKENVR